jgi:hypothetical protein
VSSVKIGRDSILPRAGRQREVVIVEAGFDVDSTASLSVIGNGAGKG